MGESSNQESQYLVSRVLGSRGIRVAAIVLGSAGLLAGVLVGIDYIPGVAMEAWNLLSAEVTPLALAIGAGAGLLTSVVCRGLAHPLRMDDGTVLPGFNPRQATRRVAVYVVLAGVGAALAALALHVGFGEAAAIGGQALAALARDVSGGTLAGGLVTLVSSMLMRNSAPENFLGE